MTPSVIRLLILIVIFASVFLISEQLISFIRQRRQGSNAINKRLQMI